MSMYPNRKINNILFPNPSYNTIWNYTYVQFNLIVQNTFWSYIYYVMKFTIKPGTWHVNILLTARPKKVYIWPNIIYNLPKTYTQKYLNSSIPLLYFMHTYTNKLFINNFRLVLPFGFDFFVMCCVLAC